LRVCEKELNPRDVLGGRGETGEPKNVYDWGPGDRRKNLKEAKKDGDTDRIQESGSGGIMRTKAQRKKKAREKL